MTREDIEKASVEHQMSQRPMAIGGDAFADMVYKMNINPSFIAGAEWISNNLWKPADGDDLPEYEREVIVLIQPYPLEGTEYAVSFAHRPDPNGYDGKSITTGKIEHYTPETYDKGGWSIPNVVWWLDYNMDLIFERNNENNKNDKG